MTTDDKVNILLVDDVPAKMLALESVLSELGQNIYKARSGNEALRLLLQHEFSVILLDVNMPGMDGFETASLIRQRKNSEHTPIIFITAINTGETHVVKGYSLGAVDYIFTPVVPEVLKAKVSVFVELCKKTWEIKCQAQELARSNRELEQFAYVASHDLQEPLRMVGNYTQLLARRYKDKLDAEAEEFIGFAVNGVSRMQALVNDLLEYSRVGRRGKEFSITNCENVIRNVLQQLRTSIEEAKGVVTYNLLPSVFADHSQLAQLFQNLIANSLKFRGNKVPQIHVSAEEGVNDWIFSVSDNGIGIDPQYSERIFLIFQRLHTCTEYPGTGIGLAICKKIVEHHGGRIWVKSAAGVGCTFSFTIPKVKESKLSSLSEKTMDSFKAKDLTNESELHSILDH